MISIRKLAAPVIAGLVAASAVAWAAQTNYLGTVFIGDSTSPANQLKVNSDGSINTAGTFSATLSGFAPGGAYATLSAGTATSNVALPSGATVVVYNNGGTPVFVKLGTSSGVTVTTSTGDVVQPGSAQAFTVGSNTFIAAITASGTDALVISGGTGLATGWGGGASSGGGSSAITTWAGGTLGAMANYGTSPGAVLAPGVNAFVTNPITLGGTLPAFASIPTVNIGTMPSLVAGSAIVGKVGIDQTTPGTTNGVQVNAALPAGTNLLGKTGIDQTTPGTTNKVNAGGTTNSVCVTPTITASTYTSGQELGGLMTFSNMFGSAGSGVVQSIIINSKTKQASGTVRFYPFTSNPSNTTWTDHATPAINAADVFAVRPPIDLATAYSDLGTHTSWSATGIGQAANPGGTTFYGVLVATSALGAFAGTTDVQVCLNTLAD